MALATQQAIKPHHAEMRFEQAPRMDEQFLALGFTIPSGNHRQDLRAPSQAPIDSLTQLHPGRIDIDVAYHDEYLSGPDQKTVQNAFNGMLALLANDKDLFSRLPATGIHVVPVSGDSAIFSCLETNLGMHSRHPVQEILQHRENAAMVTVSFHLTDGSDCHWIFLRPKSYQDIGNPSFAPLAQATFMFDKELQRISIRQAKSPLAFENGEGSQALIQAQSSILGIIELGKLAGVPDTQHGPIQALKKALLKAGRE